MKLKAVAKAAPKSGAKAATPAAPRTSTVKTYTPTPIQGIGWAPFRYPLG